MNPVDGPRPDRADNRLFHCRFADIEETSVPAFHAINEVMSGLNAEFQLPDHAQLNARIYPWAGGRYPIPELYGSRLWEYPFAILGAAIEEGMECADVGCGRTPFTAYLSKIGRANVTGFDPDIYTETDRGTAFGVSTDFARRAGFSVRASGMEKLDSPDNHFDRVFCLSVMEHLDAQTAKTGMQEMARILKPGGRLLLTLDVSIDETYSEADPLSLIWESGLRPLAHVDLAWPRRRLGVGYDVYGLILAKSDDEVDDRCPLRGSSASRIKSSEIPRFRRPLQARIHDPKPIPWPRRLQMAFSFFLNGNRPRKSRSAKP